MIAAAIGFLIIGGGVACLLGQIAWSVWKRQEYRDRTGDPYEVFALATPVTRRPGPSAPARSAARKGRKAR
jgi:hypothetical protein